MEDKSPLLIDDKKEPDTAQTTVDHNVVSHLARIKRTHNIALVLLLGLAILCLGLIYVIVSGILDQEKTIIVNVPKPTPTPIPTPTPTPSPTPKMQEAVLSIPREGLIAEWLFNGDIMDYSGKGHHGYGSGISSVPNRFNQLRSACKFHGPNSRITIPRMYIGNDLTITGWVTFDQFTKHPRIFDGGDFRMFLDPTNRILEFSIRGKDGAVTQKGISNFAHLNVWMFFAVSSSQAGSIRMYRNDILCQTEERAHYVELKTRQIILGNNEENTRGLFGSLDDIRIYNRILSENEIMALYHEGNWGK